MGPTPATNTTAVSQLTTGVEPGKTLSPRQVEERTLKLMESFDGLGHCVDYRVQDLERKLQDLSEVPSHKNVIDVFMSAIWLEKVDTENRWLNEAIKARRICRSFALALWSNNPEEGLVQAFMKRLDELEERLRTTGTTRRTQ